MRCVPFAHGCSQDVADPVFFLLAACSGAGPHEHEHNTNGSHASHNSHARCTHTHNTHGIPPPKAHRLHTNLAKMRVCTRGASVAPMRCAGWRSRAKILKRCQARVDTSQFTQGERKQPQNFAPTTHSPPMTTTTPDSRKPANARVMAGRATWAEHANAQR